MRLPVVVMAAAVLLGIGSVPASAETVRHRDPARDMHRTDASHQVHDAPRHAEGDIVRAVVRHQHHRIVLSQDYRRLTKRGNAQHTYNIQVPGGEVFQVNGGYHDGRHSFHLYDLTQGKQLACRGLSMRFDYRHDRTRVSVPRRCVDRPTWIRVGSYYAGTIDGRYFSDDARSDGRHPSPDGPYGVVYGPRVRRG